MKKFFSRFSLTLVLVAGLVACSSDSSGDNELPDPNSPDETSSEAGTYQQTLGSDMKFDEKSAVWIYELDSEFKETGRKFLADRKTEGSITTFVTDSLTLKNRYALVKTEGFRIRSYEVFPAEYFTEVPLTILVDMKDTLPVCISLAGYLETNRALAHITLGKEPAEAMQLAHEELLKVFYWDVDELKNVSFIHNEPWKLGWHAADVVGQLFERFMLGGELDLALQNFILEFAIKGLITDYPRFIPVLDYYADELRNTRFSISDNRDYYGKKPVLMQLFMAGLYGLGECVSKNFCEMKNLDYEKSEYNDSVFICDTLGWMLSSQTYRNTCKYGEAEDREVRPGLIDTTILYYYHGTFHIWQECSELQTAIGMCKESRFGEYASVGDSAFYYCNNNLWQEQTRDQYNMSAIVCDSAENYTTVGRDSTTLYRCFFGTPKVLEGDETFFIENTAGLKCDTVPDLLLGRDSVTQYVCDMGKLREVDNLEAKANRGCTSYNYDDVAQIEYSIYRCRGQWKYFKDSLYRDTVTDARDAQKYPLIGMGSQLWFAANLNYATDSSWCYNDSTANCDKYGRLYRLAEAAADKEDSLLCPKGFHVPSKEEFETFTEFVTQWRPSNESLSPLLKSKSSGGMDYYGFNAELAGVRNDGAFNYMGNAYYMCSKGATTANSVRRWRLATDLSFTYDTVPVSNTCYIRCVRD